MTSTSTGTIGHPGWPFVGRDGEVEGIVGTITEPSHGGAVVSGPAGVGKSRLAAEAVARALSRDRDLVVLRAAGSRSLSSVPFGAISHLVAEMAPLEGDETPLTIVKKLTEGLADRSGGGRRPVLVLDDAHQLDLPSLGVVQQLVLSERLRVVATVRAGAAVPEPLAALGRSDHLVHFRLGPLDEGAEERLVGAMLGGVADRMTLVALRSATHGNPLLLANLVRDGLDSGALAVREGVWHWSGRIGAGARLSQVVQGRLAALPDEERAGIEYLALGSPLPATVLIELVGQEAIDRLATRHLVEVGGTEPHLEVGVAHPLYGELMGDLVAPLRRRSLYARLVERYLEVMSGSVTDALRVAVWSLEGGVPVPPTLLTAAARFSNTAHDYDMATRLAEAAQRAGGGTAAGLELAHAQRFAGAPRAALATLSGMATTDAAAGPDALDHLMVRSLLESQTLAYSLGEVDAGQRVLADALGRLDGARATRIEAEQVVQLLWAGRFDEGIGPAEELLADDAVAVEIRLRLVAPVAIQRCFAGRSDGALDIVDAYMPLAVERLGELRWAAEELVSTRYFAQTYCGELALVEQGPLLQAASERGLQFRLDPGQDQLGLGRIALLGGRALDAGPLLRGAVAFYRENDPSGFLPLASALLAHASALEGDRDGARSYAEEARRLRGVSRALEPEIRWCLAWAVLAADGRVGVRTGLSELAGWCRRQGHVAMELWARHDLLRLGARDQADAVVALAPSVAGAWSAAFAAHAAGLAADDGEGLAGAAERFEAIGAHLCAAEAATDATLAYERQGDRRRATEQRRVATRLAAAGDGTRTPGSHHTAGPVPLTTREREVAELAARGLPNSEIAQRLSVSVRTVEGHLGRIYVKIGVSDRAALAGLLGVPAPPGAR